MTLLPLFNQFPNTVSPCCNPTPTINPAQVISRGHIAVEVGWKCDLCEFLNFNKIMTVAGVNISQSCEIDHSECHCRSGRQMVSQICQARSPDKNLGATDPRGPPPPPPLVANAVCSYHCNVHRNCVNVGCVSHVVIARTLSQSRLACPPYGQDSGGWSHPKRHPLL